MTRCIFIDSTLPGLAVGVGDRTTGQLLACDVSLPEHGSSTRLAGMVAAAMAASSTKWEHVEGIVSATGPGSFTGIRMSLAFAYGVKTACPQVKLAGTSSLALMQRFRAGGEETLVLPGTRDQGFVASPTRGSEPPVRSFFLKDWDVHREAIMGRPCILLAPWPEFEARRDGDNPPSRFGNMNRLYGADLLRYSLECLAQWSLRINWSDAEYATRLPRPDYMRASTAEENLIKRGGQVHA